MFRIGIIGSDNSHALAFSKILNLKDEKTGEYNFPDARVTHIFGLGKQRTEEVAAAGNIECIVENPDEMIGKVDAVMVVFRHGDLHAQYAMPFIERGIPTWVDKPFTIKIDEAKKMIEAAERNNTLLTGGSTNKYNYDVLMLKHAVENKADIGETVGEILGGVMNYPIMLENENGGFYFYASHLAEMVMTVFGYDIKSVTATVNNGNVVVVAKYESYQVALNYVDSWGKYMGIVFGSKATVVREIDDKLMYTLGVEKFLEMLRAGKSTLPLKHLLIPVVFMNAAARAIETGREVFLNEFE